MGQISSECETPMQVHEFHRIAKIDGVCINETSCGLAPQDCSGNNIQVNKGNSMYKRENILKQAQRHN